MLARITTFVTAMAFAATAAAATAPDELIRTTIDELIEELDSRRSELAADKQKLYDLVEEVVVPNFAVPVIARLVLAKHWREASEAQRTQFTEQFKKLLIRTYATAMFEYTGKEKMAVKPPRMKDGERRARVETQVTLPEGQPIAVNYSFLQGEDGQWRIYDVDIDGISLVTNYRSSYGQFISRNSLDALIDNLSQKNVRLEEENAELKPGETGVEKEDT